MRIRTNYVKIPRHAYLQIYIRQYFFLDALLTAKLISLFLQMCNMEDLFYMYKHVSCMSPS